MLKGPFLLAAQSRDSETQAEVCLMSSLNAGAQCGGNRSAVWALQAPSPPLERRCQGRIRRLCAQEMGRPPHLAPFSQNESLVLAPQTLVLPCGSYSCSAWHLNSNRDHISRCSQPRLPLALLLGFESFPSSPPPPSYPSLPPRPPTPCSIPPSSIPSSSPSTSS